MTEDQLKRAAASLGLSAKQVRKMAATALGTQYGRGCAQPAHNIHRATQSNPTRNTQLKPLRHPARLSVAAYVESAPTVIRT